MKLRCMIVDDEPLARKGLEEYVQDIPYLKSVGSFENAELASEYLQHHTADLILLDIRMPRLSGIDFVKNQSNLPLIIFTTAYPEYALQSYELDVVDYLVKPISFDRFSKATQKAFEYRSLRQQALPSAPDFFFIKCDHKIEKVYFDEILFVEAMQNYCILYRTGHKMISYITLTHLQEKLPADRFMKVHKSFIVALNKVTGIEGNNLLITSTHVPISRSLKGEVVSRVLGNNFLKR